MPNNESIKKSSVVIGAVQLATLYIPAHFLNMLLSYTTDSEISLFIVPVFLGVLSSIAVFSNSKVEALFKCVFSIPVAIIFWLFMVDIEFTIRALNWVFPDYGNPSAGGNFAGFIVLSITSILNFFSIVIGLLSSHKLKNEKIDKGFYLLKGICSIICIAILLSILVLNFIMPQYSPVRG